MRIIACLIIFSVVFLYGCPDEDIEPDYFLTINNNTESDILYQMDRMYPDTAIWEENPFTELNINDFIIEADSFVKIAFFQDQIDNMLPDEKFRFFLFDKLIIETNEWSSIFKNYQILKMYELNFNDLENIEWKIDYP